MMQHISSKTLLLFVLLISAMALLLHELYLTSSLRQFEHSAISGALALANIAVALAGYRTPQRLLWAVYLIVSVAVFWLEDFTTPLSAAAALMIRAAGL